MKKIHLRLILIPVLLITGLSFSQEPNRNTAAEELFSNYYGWGPSVGFDYMFVTGKPTQGVVVDYLSPKPVNFGFNWNFYHKNNLSLRLGGYYRFYSETYNEYYPAVETPADFDFEREWSESPYENAKFNLTAEYIYPLNHRWGLNVGLGWEVLYYPEDLSFSPGWTDIGEVRLMEYVSNSTRTNWYFGPNLELGLDLKTRDFMYRLKLLYHYNVSAPQYKRTVVAQNMQQTADNVSVQILTGSYVGFTLNAYPARSLFKRKTPDVKEAIEATPVRKMFRERYFPLGLTLGVDFMKAEILAFNMSIAESSIQIDPAFHIGLHWNYFNPGRFSFRLGAAYRSYTKTYNVFVPAESTGTNTDVGISYDTPRVSSYKLSHTFEYAIPLSDKIQLVPALGMDALYAVPFKTKERFYEVEGEELIGLFNEYDGTVTKWHYNANAELGVDYKARDFLIRFKAVYSLSFSDSSDDLVTVVMNHQSGALNQQVGRITNSYWGVGMTIHPSWQLFGKQNK